MKPPTLLRPGSELRQLSTINPFKVANAGAEDAGGGNKYPALLVSLSNGKCTGLGASGYVRYKGLWPDEAIDIARKACAELEVIDEGNFNDGLASALARCQSNPLAQCAIDIALHDLFGKIKGKPVYELLELPRCPEFPSSFTFGLTDSWEELERQLEAAATLGRTSRIKLKVGGKSSAIDDIELVQRVRAMFPKASIRLDANCGWANKDTALRIIDGIAEYEVDFIEQPLPIGHADGVELFKHSQIPIVLDEDAQGLQSLEGIEERCGMFVIKLDKCGGLREARRMLDYAEANDLKVMLGCMINHGISIAALLQLLGHECIAELDADAPLLVQTDGVNEELITDDCMAIQPTGPGLGVTLVTRHA